jgi:hypothetical protein
MTFPLLLGEGRVRDMLCIKIKGKLISQPCPRGEESL